MIYFCCGASRLWLLIGIMLCSTQDVVPEDAGLPPPPLFAERTEDQVEQLLANAPPGEHDGTQVGLKTYTSGSFSTGHQLAYVIASCACLCLLLPGAMLVFSQLQGHSLSPARITHIAAMLGALSLAWILFIYSLAFSRNAHSYDVQQREIQVIDRETAPGNLFIGDLNNMAMQGMLSEWGGGVVRHPLRRAGDPIPHALFMMFQLTLFLQAVVPLMAVASGRLTGWSAFSLWLLWSALVYAPLCYWTHGGGWLADCVDAGGAVSIYIAVGFFALSLSHYSRDGSESMLQQIDPGWGRGVVMFLAGSLLLAGCRSITSAPWPTFDFLNIFLGSITGMLMWLLIAQRSAQVSSSSWPLGMIAGIVSVTSGSASVTPTSAIVVSALGTLACCSAISLQGAKLNAYRFLFAVLGVSGVAGMLLTGVFASPEIAGADIAGKPIVGLIAGDDALLRLQLLTAVVSAAVAYVGGLVLPYPATLVGTLLERLFSNGKSSEHVRNSEVATHAQA